MFRTAGNYVRDDVVFRTIQLVSAELGELHSYVVREMWRSIKETGDNASEKQPLVQVRRFLLTLSYNLLGIPF